MTEDVDTSTKARRPVSPYDEPTPEKIAFGKRLREAREIAGMSQGEAAEAMGYSQAVQLSLMETGQRMPTVRVLIHAAVLYGCTVDFLCGVVEDSDRDPALAMQRHMTAMMETQVKRLVERMVDASVSASRILPSVIECERLASTMIEVAEAMRGFQALNPKFDDMRGGAKLAARVELARTLALQFAGNVDRAKRITAIRTMSEARQGVSGEPGKPEQFSLLPALGMIGSDR